MLLRDGEATDLDLSNPKQVRCAAHRLVCRQGDLDKRPGHCEDQHINERAFKCSVRDSNEGCEKALSCGSRKRLQALKARCNLEAGRIDRDALDGAAWNSLVVHRASDAVNDGHCNAGNLDIASGSTQLLGVLPDRLRAGCREHDANGGDCRIEGRYICY
jgi:hypothetical protein